MTEPYEFRIRAKVSSKLYFIVKIFKTVKAMREYGRNRDIPERSPFRGLCTDWLMQRERDGRRETHPSMGEILLCLPYLRYDIVTHECAHAAFAWLKRKKIQLSYTEDEHGTTRVMDTEEQFCYVQGSFIAQIYSYLLNKKIITELQ